MVKITLQKKKYLKRPKKAQRGFGRLCNTCGKRFGTVTRLKDHANTCKRGFFRHEEFISLDGYHKLVRPMCSAKMQWIPVRWSLINKDIELWAGIHPISKNKVFSLKEWPEQSEIERYFKITREMFDADGKSKDRWKTAVEWLS